jgi:hypothetical protein
MRHHTAIHTLLTADKPDSHVQEFWIAGKGVQATAVIDNARPVASPQTNDSLDTAAEHHSPCNISRCIPFAPHR